MGRALLLLLRLTTALNPLQKLLVEGELRRRPDWVDGSAAQVAPRVWRWVAEADDAVLALPELSEADARRLAASLEAAGAAVEASATRRVPTLTKRRALPPVFLRSGLDPLLRHLLGFLRTDLRFQKLGSLSSL